MPELLAVFGLGFWNFGPRTANEHLSCQSPFTFSIRSAICRGRASNGGALATTNITHYIFLRHAEILVLCNCQTTKANRCNPSLTPAAP